MNAPLTDSTAQQLAAHGVEALAEMEALYQATPLAQSDMHALRSWRPKATLYQRLKPLLALQAGSRIRQTIVDGHRLSYWEGGVHSATPVVLLHGFGASKENWGFLGAHLKRHYRLLAPDLPGFGDSQFDPDCDYDCATQADRVAEWLRSIGVQRAQLVGSSMGGAIAAQLAARHPALVAGLCLMNAAGVPGKRVSLLESGLAAGRNDLAPATRGQTPRVFQITLHHRQRWLGLMLSVLVAPEMSHRKPVNDFLFGHLVRSLIPTYQILGDISAPTLVLWGDSDQALDVTCVDAFCERIDQARAMVLPGVGHLPMLEVPALTARVLGDFWQSAKE